MINFLFHLFCCCVKAALFYASNKSSMINLRKSILVALIVWQLGHATLIGEGQAPAWWHEQQAPELFVLKTAMFS